MSDVEIKYILKEKNVKFSLKRNKLKDCVDKKYNSYLQLVE